MKIKLLLPILTGIPIASAIITPLVSCANTTNEPVAHNFFTDPWETICHYANKGICALAMAYGHGNDPLWFIGKERSVYLNHQWHLVRVVGINQDFTDKEQTHPVALTFQFVNLISRDFWDYGKKGAQLLTRWNGGPDFSANNYWASLMNHVLNTEDDDVEWVGQQSEFEHRSVYSMIRDGEPILAKNIKQVSRAVNTFDDENKKWDTTIGEAKLFCPSLANYYCRDVVYKMNSIYANEGHQYQYYALDSNIGSKGVDSYKCLVFKDCADSQSSDPEHPVGYMNWLCTPVINDLHSGTEFAFIIGADGNLETRKVSDISKYQIVGGAAVAPLFCI